MNHELLKGKRDVFFSGQRSTTNGQRHYCQLYTQKENETFYILILFNQIQSQLLKAEVKMQVRQFSAFVFKHGYNKAGLSCTALPEC